ncbi:MAG: universal stress protein [Bacteroidota bacterium]
MIFRKILIAVDSSAASMKAARAGFELAHGLKAMVGIISVVDKGKEVVNADLGITPEESRAALLEEAENMIAQFIKMYEGIAKVFRFTPEGIPEKEILRIVTEWQADLIVMGTHGRSGLSRMLTGSVAEYVIRHAEVPVMVIPSGVK